MAWLLTLFRNSTAWIFFGVVTFFLAYGSWQEHKLNKAQRAAAEWKTRAETAESALESMKLEHEKLLLALEAQQKAAVAAQAGKDAMCRTIRKEVAKDENVRDWYHTPVPDSLVQLLSGKTPGGN